MSKSFYIGAILVGIILRLFLMFSTAHPDLWAFYFSNHLFAFQGVINIYDYLADSKTFLAQNYGSNFFTYPPLAYFLLGGFAFLLRPFFEGDFFNWAVSNYPNLYQATEVYRAIFLTKLPYLFFDILSAVFLAKLFHTEREKKLAFVLWIFNPLAIYTSFMVGQFDILAVFFVVCALYLASVKKENLSLLSLGLGGALKVFPFLLLPFFVFSLSRNWHSRVKLAFIGFLPYLISILPFLGSSAFRQVSLFSAQSQKMLFMQLPVSGAEGIYIFVLAFVLLILYSFYNPGYFPIWKYSLATLLIFFSVTHYHPQWILWLAPFIIIELISSKFKHLLLWVLILLSWVSITFLFEASLNYGLFVPLNSNLLDAQSLSNFVPRFYDVFQLKSLLRTLFAASSLFLIYVAFQKNQTASK